MATVPIFPAQGDAPTGMAAAFLGLDPRDLAHPATLAALAQLRAHLAIIERDPLPDLPDTPAP